MNLELRYALSQAGIETRDDAVTRTVYSTDASMYQIEPGAVAFPRVLDDLNAIVELAARHGISVVARGAGSGLTGGALGSGLIVDTSRYLDKIGAVHQEEDGQNWAEVQPGVILGALNRAVAQRGLQVGPDPASVDRATVGGCIANNATGAHSIRYGMFADHLIAVDAVLGDGNTATFSEISLSLAAQRATNTDRPESALYSAALDIRKHQADTIRARWPRTWRRAAGYNLNYLLPWSPSAPPMWPAPHYPAINSEHINLAALIAGSEGTLGLIRKAAIRLVAKPKHTILAVLFFDDAASACDATPAILEHAPTAIELIPRALIDLAKAMPSYAQLLSFLPPASRSDLLVVEYSGDHADELRQKARKLHPDALIAESVQQQSQVWAVRKVGLGLLQSQPGDLRTHTFIEDLAVPVEHLGVYVREMQRIFTAHSTRGHFYAHASAGCLHMRPILNLKTESGRAHLRSIAEDAVDLVISLGGATTGEHGDGLARSEWLERLYGPEIVAAFRTLKRAADPQGIFNPGKIVDPLPMDQNLRYEQGHLVQGWQTALDFSRQGGLQNAIEICNGAGVCRKTDGSMCPSFQATREEQHSTRGRANLLRALIQRPSSVAYNAEPVNAVDVWGALDLCLACKGCKAECPSGVDMAKLKYEFLHHYYQTHRRKLRDYLFGYIDIFARIGAPLGKWLNWGMEKKAIRNVFSSIFHLSPERKLPLYADTHAPDAYRPAIDTLKPCILLMDSFTEYFYPEAKHAALHVLAQMGYGAQILPILGAGRTLISKGFLDAAKRRAEQVLAAIEKLDPDGKLPILGLEPSEIYTFSDEYLDFFPGDQRTIRAVQRAWMIDEFFIRHVNTPSTLRIAPAKVLLHGHCYQKARPPAADGLPVGVGATVAMLEIAGYQVQVADAGCCGMAGAFGYEAEHYALSMQIGEMQLFPALRKAGEGVIVAASGISCQAQIGDCTNIKAVHPLTLMLDQPEGE